MAAQQQMSAAQINSIARSTIGARAVRRNQVIYSQTVTPANNPTLTINPRNVGLGLGFWVKIVATVNNASGETINLADFGASNVLSQIQFNDLQNNTRVQTQGWHLATVNSWKGRKVFANSFIGQGGTNQGLQTTGNAAAQDSPLNVGSNWTGNSAPLTIATGTTGTVTFWYYVPLAYNPDRPQAPDLRGAVYLNVVNATAQLFLSFAGSYGTSVCAANGADSTLAMYVQATTGGTPASVTISSATVTVYQDYYDQLPTGPQGVLLPILDLATIYELKYTPFNQITQGQDSPYQYSNFRDFLSTTAIYVNNGSTGARGVGADINYWALQAANFSNIWKEEPSLVAIRTRQHMGIDWPPGMYFFDSRNKPISTTQYGNMQLILNPSTATSNPYALVGVEDLALVQTLSMAGSLAAS